MKRTAGAYKRMLYPWLLVLSLIVAGAIDVDAIRIANRLYYDPSLRSATSQQARGYEGSGFDRSMQAIGELQLPIGWWELSATKPGSEAVASGGKSYFNAHPELSIFGVIISGFLLSLGATFWFQFMSMFVNLRGVGAAPSGPGGVVVAAKNPSR